MAVRCRVFEHERRFARDGLRDAFDRRARDREVHALRRERRVGVLQQRVDGRHVVRAGDANRIGHGAVPSKSGWRAIVRAPASRAFAFASSRAPAAVSSSSACAPASKRSDAIRGRRRRPACRRRIRQSRGGDAMRRARAARRRACRARSAFRAGRSGAAAAGLADVRVRLFEAADVDGGRVAHLNAKALMSARESRRRVAGAGDDRGDGQQRRAAARRVAIGVERALQIRRGGIQMRRVDERPAEPRGERGAFRAGAEQERLRGAGGRGVACSVAPS